MNIQFGAVHHLTQRTQNIVKAIEDASNHDAVTVANRSTLAARMEDVAVLSSSTSQEVKVDGESYIITNTTYPGSGSESENSDLSDLQGGMSAEEIIERAKEEDRIYDQNS